MAKKKEINFDNVPIEFPSEIEMNTIFVANVEVLYKQTNRKTKIESKPSTMTLENIVMKMSKDNSINVRRIARKINANINPLKFTVKVKNSN